VRRAAVTRDDADGEEAAADDQDNLDDMAAEADMAAPMLARARAIFDQLDTDGMGTLSKAELKAGLLADYELQSLPGADADSAHAMMDLDGDGEISWMEFEMMFSSSSQAPEESTAIDLAATEEEAPPP
jgi:Ca2+-binding EF-hand superfamily protein